MPPLLRPRFEHRVALPPRQVITRLDTALADPSAVCRATRAGHHLWIHVRPEVRHTWSPWLDLEVDADPDGSFLRGRYGPHPSILSFFVALYAICAFLALGGLIVGLSQLGLGFPAWGLWAVPGAAVLAVLVYLVARTGQRLAQEQMQQIQAFIDQTLTVPADPPDPSLRRP